MKKLICGLGLALGLSFSCHAQGMKISAYPNTNNLAGTNLFLIAIVGSPGTNMNISYAQLSNLLAAAIGGGGGGAQPTNYPHFTLYADFLVTNAVVDFSTNTETFYTLSATNDICFLHSTNRVATRAAGIRIIAGSTNRILSFNTNWNFIGSLPPTLIASNKTAKLVIECFGPLESDVLAGYAETP